MSDENDSRAGRWNRSGGGLGRAIKLFFVTAAALALVYPCYAWFVKRVEVAPKQLLVLINKTGKPIPREFGDQSVLHPALLKSIAAQTGASPEAVEEDYKGIRYDVLKEGRHFYSPIWFQREVIPATMIPDGKFGVKVRRYGKPLPPGKTVATADDERGPVAGTLPPGRHDINTFAYEVKVFDKIVIPEGFTGIQTILSGPDPAKPNEYVVQPGERGVQADTLAPGTYQDRNPYVVRIDPVDLRSQKYDMLDSQSIEFPSSDGFPIHMEATVEWAIIPDRAPWVMVEVGDLEDIETKVIRPYTMSLSRIQGSKLIARDFIGAGAREHFQSKLVNDLRQKCREQGVLIKAALVRDLKPPDVVRGILSEREKADQTIMRCDNETAEARERAKLVEQQELASQKQAMGDANKQVVTLTTKARESVAVALTEASQRLEVAKLDLESARKNAQAILARGDADAKVILYEFQAQAEPLRGMVKAFGDGQTYARNQFLQKLAPAIRSILTNTEGPLADILRSFDAGAQPGGEGDEAAKGGTP